jgi:REP element-mobilizing transposase RayT
MPNSYTQLYIQFVFAVKYRTALIDDSWKKDLYKYITGIVKNKGNKMLAINGMPDHIHIFIGYKPTTAIPDLVKDIKVASNVWVKENKLSNNAFAWQDGYGAFSYSRSHIDEVIRYIQNQEQHHKKNSFREEYVAFLKRFDIDFDDKYLFEFFTDHAISKDSK